MKINANDTTKLQSALDKVQAKAQKRLISVEDIQSAIKLVERKIAPLPKAHRKGITFTFASDERIANSYKYAAHSTYCTIEYGGGGWFVTAIDRDFALKNNNRNGWLGMNAEQKTKLANAIIDSVKF